MLRNSDANHATLEQAAEWFAVLRDGQAGEEDTAAWQQWLAATDENRVAWHYVQQISRRFEPLQKTPDPKRTTRKLEEANARLQQRRQILAGIGGLAGIGLMSMWGTPLPGVMAALGADHRTTTGQQRQLMLADGSRAWLNTASAMDFHLTPQLRRVVLLNGEVFIDTAKDAKRPFVVETRHGSLRALGTRFDVHTTDNKSHLAVYEGAVEIRTLSGATRIIPTGEQSTFTAQDITPLTSADRAREAWTRGLLVAEDIPLRQLIAELRRYRHGHIGISDDVAELRVYGSFPLHNTDQVLAMLTTVLPVDIKRTMPWWVSIEPRSS